jgi:hypothetical protein
MLLTMITTHQPATDLGFFSSQEFHEANLHPQILAIMTII